MILQHRTSFTLLKGIKEYNHKPTLKTLSLLRRHKTIEEKILYPEFNKEVSDNEKEIALIQITLRR